MLTVRAELAEALAQPVDRAMRVLVAVAVKAHRVNRGVDTQRCAALFEAFIDEGARLLTGYLKG